MFSDLQKAVNLSPIYKNYAKENKDFKEYWDDPDFKKIVDEN